MKKGVLWWLFFAVARNTLWIAAESWLAQNFGSSFLVLLDANDLVAHGLSISMYFWSVSEPRSVTVSLHNVRTWSTWWPKCVAQVVRFQCAMAWTKGPSLRGLPCGLTFDKAWTGNIHRVHVEKWRSHWMRGFPVVIFDDQRGHFLEGLANLIWAALQGVSVFMTAFSDVCKSCWLSQIYHLMVHGSTERMI